MQQKPRGVVFWLKVLIPVWLVLLVAGAAIKLLHSEIPACARPEAIQERFARELEVLRELAAIEPEGGWDVEPPRRHDDRERWSAWAKQRREWLKQFTSRARDFEDPAILGASITGQEASGRTARIVVKHYEDSPVSFPLSKTAPAAEGPSVTLMFSGGRYLASYEEDVACANGSTRTITLVADTAALEREAAAGASSAPARRERLAAKLEEYCRSHELPGATAAAVFGTGRALAAAAGFSNLENQTPMAAGDRILAGSIGKTYVAAVALQLVAEGALDLDAPIARWLGSAEWFPRLPNGGSITVRMLMNHTSGVPEHVMKPEFGAQVGANPDRVWEPQELVAFILDEEPLFPAGAGWSYADTNYILLGMIIEKAAGAAFFDELKKRVLEPHLLTETDPALGRTMAGLVPGYAGDRTPFKKTGKTIENGLFVIDPQVEWTGGGLVTTARDLARWGSVLFHKGAFPESLWEQYIAGVPATLAEGDRYGLGVQMWESSLGPCLGHGGWFPGYVSLLAYFQDLDLVVALQINTDKLPKGSATLRALCEGLAGALEE